MPQSLRTSSDRRATRARDNPDINIKTRLVLVGAILSRRGHKRRNVEPLKVNECSVGDVKRLTEKLELIFQHCSECAETLVTSHNVKKGSWSVHIPELWH